MITTSYLKKKGFVEHKLFCSIPRGIFRKPISQLWGYSYKIGDIEISICCLDNDSPFEYKINGQNLGVLPDSKKYIKQLIKFYG